MSDLKPLGSEKLGVDEKLKRILELTYYNNNKKSSTTKAELVKESKTGGVYGIVKEKDGYYVKRGLNESSLDYIGGMFMKNKNKFSSYAEASKRLSLIQGQEELHEATKYVLKPQASGTTQSEAPMPDPSMDAAPAPAPDMGGDAPAPDMGGDMGSDESGKRSSYMAEVQKYAGKLGQELRDQHEQMESDDIKYVLNMIISACDLDKLDDEDIEEIGKKFERDEEVGGEEPTGEEPAMEPSAEPAATEPSPESEMGESMNALEAFVNSSAPHQQDEMSLDGYMDQHESLDGHEGQMEEEGQQDETKVLDLEEIKKDINDSISKTLHKYFN
jgi:hypothetical protein